MYSQSLVNQSKTRLETEFLHTPLIEYTRGEVDEWSWRLRDAFDRDGNTLRPLSDEEAAFITNEISLCKVDFVRWAKLYCKFNDEAGRISTLEMWPSQQRVLDALAVQEEKDMASVGRLKGRLIILKPRQIGITTFCQALIAHLVFLNPLYRSVVASDHSDNSLKVFESLDRIYSYLPNWMKPHRAGRVKGTHMLFDESESSILVGAGNQETSLGQGMTIDALHLTEVSTWKYWFDIPSDIMLAFDSSQKHHSVAILESTANGAEGNFFHDKYQSAKRGDSEFQAIFVGWHLRPTYRRPSEGVTFTPETLGMAERVKRESGVELDREQLSYYQVKRREYASEGRLMLFYQEHCSTEDEAWQTGFDSVFPLEVITKVRDGCRVPQAVFKVDPHTGKLLEERDWKMERGSHNRLLVWEGNKKGNVYVVAVDASYGIEGKDAASIQVIRVGTRSYPDEQVAEYAGTIDPIDLAKLVWTVGHLYTDHLNGTPAKVAVEANPGSPGTITQPELIRLGYPHFYVWRRTNQVGGGYTKSVGWYTTPSTRPFLTESGEKAIMEASLKVNSQWTVDEMRKFIAHPLQLGRVRHEAASGCHDDRLMALFIALVVAHEDDTLNLAEERRKDIMDNAVRAGMGLTKPRSYQNDSRFPTLESAEAHWRETYFDS